MLHPPGLQQRRLQRHAQTAGRGGCSRGRQVCQRVSEAPGGDRGAPLPRRGPGSPRPGSLHQVGDAKKTTNTHETVAVATLVLRKQREMLANTCFLTGRRCRSCRRGIKNTPITSDTAVLCIYVDERGWRGLPCFSVRHGNTTHEFVRPVENRSIDRRSRNICNLQHVDISSFLQTTNIKNHAAACVFVAFCRRLPFVWHCLVSAY